MRNLNAMSILIVDDSKDICLSTKDLLEAVGYSDVRIALSAHEAFWQLGLGHPPTPLHQVDSILMDVSMPEIGGIEAVKRIKANDNLRDIPIIVVTGQTEDSVLKEAFAAGAMDFVIKPASTVELLARLRSALTLKNELDCRRKREHELSELTRELVEKNLILEHLSTIDAVTGIATRRCFDSALCSEWQRTGRDGVPLSLIMIDSDDFKAFNDTYGHPDGDLCLRQIAQVLSNTVKRPGDVVARYGGEEFSIILPNTNLEGAYSLAQKLVSRIEDLKIPHSGSVTGYVTISCGVATIVPNSMLSSVLLVTAADRALYLAKRRGKNQACVLSVEDENARPTPER